MTLNTFKLHTYEASIVAALVNNLPVKELEARVYRYYKYCMQLDMRPEFTFAEQFSIDLYNKNNFKIYTISYNLKERLNA